MKKKRNQKFRERKNYCKLKIKWHSSITAWCVKRCFELEYAILTFQSRVRINWSMTVYILTDDDLSSVLWLFAFHSFKNTTINQRECRRARASKQRHSALSRSCRATNGIEQENQGTKDRMRFFLSLEKK